MEIMRDAFSADEGVNLNEAGFKIAFGVFDYDTKQILNDPEFVQFDFYLETRKNLDVIQKVPLRSHKCTQQDFNEFNEIR